MRDRILLPPGDLFLCDFYLFVCFSSCLLCAKQLAQCFDLSMGATIPPDTNMSTQGPYYSYKWGYNPPVHSCFFTPLSLVISPLLISTPRSLTTNAPKKWRNWKMNLSFWGPFACFQGQTRCFSFGKTT